MLQRNAKGELVLSFAAIKMEDMEEAVRLLHALLEAAKEKESRKPKAAP